MDLPCRTYWQGMALQVHRRERVDRMDEMRHAFAADKEEYSAAVARMLEPPAITDEEVEARADDELFALQMSRKVRGR